MLYKKLYDYQKDVVDKALGIKTAALFAKQRTGKTWMSMAIIEHLMEIDPSYEGLYIVPLSNINTTWQKQLNAQLPGLTVCKDWEQYKAADTPKAFLLHYEGLPKIIQAILRRNRWSQIILDESQRIKARGTRQSRGAKRLRNKAEYKLILSGTPIEQAPQDLWAQFRFLAPQVFGERWSDFDTEFLKPTGYMGYQRKFKPEKMSKFLRLIKPYAIRVDKSVLKMPDSDLQRIVCPMFGDQERLYREMEQDQVTWFEDSRIMADMTLTQHVRLQQIAGGFIALDNAEDEKAPPDMIPIGSTKLRKLKALSRRLEPPFVVFCKYKAELFAVHRMMSVLYDRVELFYGKTPRDERDRLQADFQNGLIEVLICQNRTGGLGIDLYRTSTAIIYSLTFSYIDFDQLISRFDLYKKKQAVKIILLLAQNSIDEDVLSLVLNKENVSESTLRKLQRRRSKSMATKKKKVTKKVTKKAAKAPKASETKKAAGAPKASETFKYTVADLAKVLGIKEASVRIKLRNNEIDKAGRAYGWNSKAEYEKVLKQLKA